MNRLAITAAALLLAFPLTRAGSIEERVASLERRVDELERRGQPAPAWTRAQIRELGKAIMALSFGEATPAALDRRFHGPSEAMNDVMRLTREASSCVTEAEKAIALGVTPRFACEQAQRALRLYNQVAGLLGLEERRRE